MSRRDNFLKKLNAHYWLDPTFDLNSPFNREVFAGDEYGKKMVYGTFETSEYYASKGLVTPWQRNRKPTLMNKEKRGGKRPEIGDW